MSTEQPGTDPTGPVAPGRGEPHPEQVPDDEVADRPAPWVVPVPAASLAGALTRRRVVRHDPFVPATISDLVALDEPSGTGTEIEQQVPVLELGEFHRHVHLGTPAQPVRVPLPELWVERLYTREELIPDDLTTPEPARPEGAGQVDDPDVWVHDTTRPAVRQLVRGDQAGRRQLVGARAVLSNRAGLHVGIRIISEPFFADFEWLPAELDDVGKTVWIQSVTCCLERDWALWTATGRTPESAGARPLLRLFLD